MAPTPEDAEAVKQQLGRTPKGEWEVASRCPSGHPQVVRVYPIVDGKPFPNTYWLCCPNINAQISRLEITGIMKAGAGDVWEALLSGRGFLEEGQKVIGIHETDAETLGLVVRSVYGLEGAVGVDDCVHMINAADKFGMEDLHSALVARFIELRPTFAHHRHLFLRILLATVQMECTVSDGGINLGYETVAKKKKYDQTNDEKLRPLYCVHEAVREYCEAQVVAGFGILLSDEELLRQMNDKAMKQLLDSDDLNMPEIEIFRGVVKWSTLTHVPLCGSGKPLHLELEECIRYPMMTGTEMAEVRKSGLVCDRTMLRAYRARTESHVDGVDLEWPDDRISPRLSRQVTITPPPLSDDLIGDMVDSESFTCSGSDWNFLAKYAIKEPEGREGAAPAEPAKTKLSLWIYLKWHGAPDEQPSEEAGVVASYTVRCKSLPGMLAFGLHNYYTHLHGEKYAGDWGAEILEFDPDHVSPLLVAGGPLTVDFGLCVRPV